MLNAADPRPLHDVFAGVDHTAAELQEGRPPSYGMDPFGSAESVGVREALRSYTIWAARQLFLELNFRQDRSRGAGFGEICSGQVPSLTPPVA
jgi:hypothetical protein